MLPKVLFGVVTWLGVLANFTFSVVAWFAPGTLFQLLGVEAPVDQVWLKDAGLLLVFLSLMYLPAGANPEVFRWNAVVGVAARLVFAGFWFCLVLYCNYSRGFLILAFTDLGFGLLQGWLLSKVNRKLDGLPLF